jgi:hypothetical protein
LLLIAESTASKIWSGLWISLWRSRLPGALPRLAWFIAD